MPAGEAVRRIGADQAVAAVCVSAETLTYVGAIGREGTAAAVLGPDALQSESTRADIAAVETGFDSGKLKPLSYNPIRLYHFDDAAV